MIIKIAIIEDHPLLIKGLCSMLQHHADIEVSGVYLEVEKLLEGLSHSQPDILLLDIQMKDMGGDELATLLAKKYKSLRLLVFTNMDHEYYIEALLKSGAKGYVLKSSSESVLLSAIKAVYNDEEYLDPDIRRVVAKIRSKTRQKPLITRREREVLELIAKDNNSDAIAKKLVLSKRTIDNHRANLLLKLQVKNSASLVKKAIDLGLLK